jgi:hypothetical protein
MGALISLELILPERIKKKLRGKCEKTGVSIGELALEALYKGLNEKMDPFDKAEAYMNLSEKYLKDADELLAKRDYIQASEKLWGSAALTVKAVAASREATILSHGELFSLLESYVKRKMSRSLEGFFQ